MKETIHKKDQTKSFNQIHVRAAGVYSCGVCVCACVCVKFYGFSVLCSFKDPSLDQSPEPKCKPCPVVHPSPVCGTDGHSYSTKVAACTLTARERTQGPRNRSDLSSVPVAQCKLDYQACMTGKKIGVKCPGTCPCPAPLQTSSTDKTGIDSDLRLSSSALETTDLCILIWFFFAAPQFAASWT